MKMKLLPGAGRGAALDFVNILGRASISIMLLGWLSTAVAADSLPPGNHEFSVRHGGLKRYYLVHVPPQASAGRSLPVVMAFHGGGSVPVLHWRLHGSGHSWPGQKPMLPERIMGPSTQLFNASEEIWSFFKRHAR